MPKLKTLRDFGPEFEAILTRADTALRTGQSEFIVDFIDSKAAHTVRFNCYAFFKAIRASSERPDLVVACQDLSMRLAGGSLVFYRSNDSTAAAAIRNALNLPKIDNLLNTQSPRPSTLDGNLERLREMREGRGSK